MKQMGIPAQVNLPGVGRNLQVTSQLSTILASYFSDFQKVQAFADRVLEREVEKSEHLLMQDHIFSPRTFLLKDKVSLSKFAREFPSSARAAASLEKLVGAGSIPLRYTS